jgi:hypothetical protein
MRTLLAAGANPSARDDIGATALMHTAFVTDGLRALRGGAEVNASSTGAATADVGGWRPAKVQLLLIAARR